VVELSERESQDPWEGGAEEINEKTPASANGIRAGGYRKTDPIFGRKQGGWMQGTRNLGGSKADVQQGYQERSENVLPR